MECGKSIVLMSVDKEIQMKMKKAINHLKHECKVKIDEVRNTCTHSIYHRQIY